MSFELNEKWENFGDLNFEEYGGTIVKENDNDVEFFWVGTGYDRNNDEAIFASKGMLDKNDLLDRQANDKRTRSALKEMGINPDKATFNQIAAALIDTYGVLNMGGMAVYEYNAYPSTLEDLTVTPEQLHESLKYVGAVDEPPVFISEKYNSLDLDIDIEKERFCATCQIELPEDIVSQITEEFKKDKCGYDKIFDLDTVAFSFSAQQDINDLSDTPFYEKEIRVTALTKGEDAHRAYLNNADLAIIGMGGNLYSKLVSSAENAVIAYFGTQACEEIYSIDNQIKCIADTARCVLDRDTNPVRAVDRFYNEENDDYGFTSFRVEISLDESFDDVYEITVESTCDGERGTGIVYGVEDANLEQTLRDIADGSAKVIAKEFSDKPISCIELASKTVEKFNRKQTRETELQKGE